MGDQTVLILRSTECGWTELLGVLGTMPDLRVVGQATSGQQAEALAVEHRPSVVIAPAQLNGLGTQPLLSHLRTQVTPHCKVIIIASRFARQELSGFASVGISGHLLWADLSTTALRNLFELVIPNALVVASQDIATAFVDLQSEKRPSHDMRPRLTESERNVLRWLGEGLTHAEIALREPCSSRTVDRIVAKLETKLDAPTPFLLGMKACQLGLL